jgi:hypothetical protein
MVCIGYIYLRYTIPQYNVSTTILVKDENKGDVVGTFSLADLGMGGGMKSNLD